MSCSTPRHERGRKTDMSSDTPKLNDYFDECLYFSISRLQRDINKLAENAFAETGLAPSHAFLLMALDETDALSAGEISNLLGMAPSTITRFVDKLAKQDLCKRRVEGRVSLTSITPKGRALMPAIRDGWMKLYYDYNGEYGEAEADHLNKTIVALNKRSM